MKNWIAKEPRLPAIKTPVEIRTDISIWGKCAKLKEYCEHVNATEIAMLMGGGVGDDVGTDDNDHNEH